MAASLRNRSFTNLADLNDGVLGDDYVHGAIETWKLKAKTTNGGKVDYKAKIKHSQKDGQLSGTYTDEGKFQFPYQKLHFWVGFRRSGDLKLHADFGNVNIAGKDLNVFSNLKTDVNFKNFNWRIGTNYFQDNFVSSARLETQTANSNTDLGVTTRTFYKQGNVFQAMVSSFGINDGVTLKKLDAVVGYEKDNLNLYLQHQTAAKVTGLNLGKLTATVTAKRDNNNFGVEVSKDFAKNAVAATLGVEGKLNDANIKGKINNDLDLELAFKKKVNNQLTLTASGKLALSKGAKAVDFSQYVPIPFGVQFEVNI